MSKRTPTLEERICQSTISRARLIVCLEQTLALADETVPQKAKEGMLLRIAELKRRNQDPRFSLNRGKELYRTANQPTYPAIHGWGR